MWLVFDLEWCFSPHNYLLSHAAPKRNKHCQGYWEFMEDCKLGDWLWANTYSDVSYQCSWCGTLENQYSSAVFSVFLVVLQTEEMRCISFFVIHVKHDNSCYTANGCVNVYRWVQVLGGFTPVGLVLCFSQRTAAVSLWAPSGVGLIDGLSFSTSTNSVELS